MYLRSRFNISLILLLKLIICSVFFNVTVYAQEAAVEEVVEAPQDLILSIQRGKPGEEGGSIQEFRLKSGDTAFVQLTPNEIGGKRPMTVQEQWREDAYRTEVGNISSDIATQITTIQNKQREIDTELYLAQRAPLENEKRLMQDQLEVLQDRRNQIESKKVAEDSFKPRPPPPPPPAVARGINVKTILRGSQVIFEIRTQDQTQSVVETTTNRWVTIFSSENQNGQDIWAKVDPVIP